MKPSNLSGTLKPTDLALEPLDC